MYFLGAGIYPSWPFFAKPIHNPVHYVYRTYTALQEAVGKDIELFFGVLQSLLEILIHGNRQWDVQDTLIISETSIVRHNVLVSFVEAEAVHVDDGIDKVHKFYEEDSVEGALVRKNPREVMQHRTMGVTSWVKGTVPYLSKTWIT